MFLVRMGSLNALEQLRGHRFWNWWIKGSLPSADTVGRVFSQLPTEAFRDVIHHLYSRLKRNKVLRGFSQGLIGLLMDGHESSASYLRCCSECLQRVIHSKEEEKVQYYHRQVTAMLLSGRFSLLLDIERQRPGEDEVATATRLLRRVLNKYPRAFDVIIGDGLYMRANFFHLALKADKEVIAVLKDERRDLLKDAYGLFSSIQPNVSQYGSTQRTWWDIEHFTSWPELEGEVRIVRSLEKTTVRRQISGKTEELTSEWVWATTLSKGKASGETIIDLGHGRWSIENNGFNELVNEWAFDHVYKHHPQAIEAFWLLGMLAYNLFHAFINLNIKPQIRLKHTLRHWAKIIAAELYHNITSFAPT
jgi:hypothetical protein